MKLLILISFLFSVNVLFAQEKPLVLATVNMLADMAQNIAGDHLEIKTIVPLGGDPHLYEPVPQDAQMVENAQLILKNGLTLEGWINELIENSGTKAKSYVLTGGIETIQSLDYANSPDPHAWMIAKNGIIYAENIAKAFKEFDPEHAADYDANLAKYSKELSDLHDYIGTEMQKIPKERRVLITSHDAFQYYGRAYGLRLESMIGTSTDADIQTSDITRLQKIIDQSKVPALFVESTINPKTLKQLAKDNKIGIGGKLFADSLGDEESGADSYINMLKQNTDVIVKGLTEGGTMPEATAESKSNRWIMFAIIGALFIGGFGFVLKKMNG